MDNWLKKISGKKPRVENNIDNKPNFYKPKTSCA